MVADAPRATSPGEQYVKALWRARWLFLLIVAVFVGGSLVVTALLPKSYSSESIISVKTTPRLDPSVNQYSRPDPLYPPAISSSNGPSMSDDEVGAQRLVRRLQASNLVNAAARDVGLIGPAEALDLREIRRWLSVEKFERTDLIQIIVDQPTPEKARALNAALVKRGIEASRAESSIDPNARQELEKELQRATSAMSQAEVAVREAEATGGGRANAADRARLELSLAREQYAFIRRRLGMLDVAAANQQFLVTVVDPPTLPLRQSFPRPLLNVSVGLILGILTATTLISAQSVLKSA